MNRNNTVECIVVLSEIGYQIDIRDCTKGTRDGNRVEVSSACRDFARDCDVHEMGTVDAAALISAMQQVEGI